jgi:hypothetical protein
MLNMIQPVFVYVNLMLEICICIPAFVNFYIAEYVNVFLC